MLTMNTEMQYGVVIDGIFALERGRFLVDRDCVRVEGGRQSLSRQTLHHGRTSQVLGCSCMLKGSCIMG